MGRLSYALSKLRSEVDGLLQRVPENETELDLRHLSEEELDRLEVLLAKVVAEEEGTGSFRHGAHGPGGGLENCDCAWCQQDVTPPTEDEESELVFLLRLARG